MVRACCALNAAPPQDAVNIAVMENNKQGLVLCHIGDGKGKTTAAMGLAIRASGAGMNVCILQFVKSKGSPAGDRPKDGEWPLSAEIDFFQGIESEIINKKSDRLGIIRTEQLGLGFVGILGDNKDKQAHIQAAREGVETAKKIFNTGEFQLIVLDEIISAVELKLLTEDEVVDLILVKPKSVHLVLTGHNKFEKIIAHSDVVTYMQLIKHPYYQGITAQRGIDY
jgi:cob(I)alamin adenosyltransferase